MVRHPLIQELFDKWKAKSEAEKPARRAARNARYRAASKKRRIRENEIIATTPLHEMTNSQLSQWEEEGLNVSRIIMEAGEQKLAHNKALSGLIKLHKEEYEGLCQKFFLSISEQLQSENHLND